MSDVNISVKGKVIYQVIFGRVSKFIAVSETIKGYKAKTSRGNTFQLWKGKRYSGGNSRHGVYHVEKCFFHKSSAVKYAREQLKEKEMHHKHKCEEYFKASANIEIEVM